MSHSAFELFKLRHQSGNDYRTTYIQNTRDIIENRFADDPAFRQVKVIGKGNLYVRASNYRKEGFLMPKMDIQATLDNEFFMGDLFFFDNSYWLCTMKNVFYETVYRGEITQCNNVLRFQLPNDYNIYEYYAVVERPFSRNISTGQIIQVSDKEYRIRTQLTNITKKIFLKQRFMIGMGYDDKGNEKPDVYTIDSRDPLSNAIMFEEGFLVLNIKEDQYNKDKDNKEYMVANYKSPPKILPIVPDECQIITSDNNYSVKLEDFTSKLFMGEIYNDLKEKVVDISNVVFKWSIEASSLQKKWLTYVSGVGFQKKISDYEELPTDSKILISDEQGSVLRLMCDVSKLDKNIDELLNSEFSLYVSAEDIFTGKQFNEFEAKIKIVSLI